ncbi:proteasomal ATPase-associated factor 1 isoform X2 [Xenopus tropicalis]|uniref:Proteasomal ATPase-associated factor 1 isoform X2 n=1 Tax=Xenopus tropicalis TaxID=8364 RepID=A0A8J1J671_XENTR|nr:proteasomal ATPase-associated factor 1 isoform X2 [Xenopus tropicalis]
MAVREEAVAREAEGEVWVSCKIPGKPTIRGSLTSKGISSDEVPEVTASEEFVVQEVTKNRIPVSCPGENISCTFLSPYASFSHIHGKNVSYLDISSGGDLGVSSSTDQTFKVWETHNTEVKSVLEGHTRDVFSCKFFPSGQEVLSGGLDSLVKVWSVNDGSCLATMKGHRGSILDIAVVADGQNVISSGQDGTARLWDSAQGACIAVVDDSYSPINAIAVAEVGNAVNLGSPKETPSNGEVGTEGKLVVLAREDKSLEGVSLHSRQSVFDFEGSDAFNCCTFISSVGVLAGGLDGNIIHVDIRNPKSAVETVSWSETPVLSLVPFRDTYVASYGNGTCYIPLKGSEQVLQLTGPNRQPVFQLCVWSAPLGGSINWGIPGSAQQANGPSSAPATMNCLDAIVCPLQG